MTDRESKFVASGSGWVPEGSGWDWCEEEYPIGIRLMFARGATPE